MSILWIPRMTEPATSTATMDFGKQVQDVLDYSALAEEHAQYADECALFEACVACGIRPFRTSAVERYKKRKAWRARFFSRGIKILLALYATAAGLSIWITAATADPGIGFFVIISGGCFVFVFSGLMLDSREAKWFRKHLSSFEKPIPHKVLNVALSLKKQNPNIDFVVHELEVEQRPLDPFLSARLGNAELYIARWDEPSFKAEHE